MGKTKKGALPPAQELELLWARLASAQDRLRRLPSDTHGDRGAPQEAAGLKLVRDITLLKLQIANVERWIDRTPARDARLSIELEKGKAALPEPTPNTRRNVRRARAESRRRNQNRTTQQGQWIVAEHSQDVQAVAPRRSGRKPDDPSRGISLSTGRRRRANLIG